MPHNTTDDLKKIIEAQKRSQAAAKSLKAILAAEKSIEESEN